MVCNCSLPLITFTPATPLEIIVGTPFCKSSPSACAGTFEAIVVSFMASFGMGLWDFGF